MIQLEENNNSIAFGSAFCDIPAFAITPYAALANDATTTTARTATKAIIRKAEAAAETAANAKTK